MELTMIPKIDYEHEQIKENVLSKGILRDIPQQKRKAILEAKKEFERTLENQYDFYNTRDRTINEKLMELHNLIVPEPCDECQKRTEALFLK